MYIPRQDDIYGIKAKWKSENVNVVKVLQAQFGRTGVSFYIKNRLFEMNRYEKRLRETPLLHPCLQPTLSLPPHKQMSTANMKAHGYRHKKLAQIAH